MAGGQRGWWLAFLFVGVVACASHDPAKTRTDAIARGDALAEEGKAAQAVQAYNAALAVQPLDGPTLLKLSKSAWAAEQWDAGAKAGIKAAELLHDDLEAQLRGVEMLLFTSRWDDARERIADLSRRYPGNTDLPVYQGLSEAHLFSGTYAMSRLTTALADGENYEWVRQTMRPNLQQASDRAAETSFRRALAAAPDDGGTKMAWLSFLWAVGRQDEAEPMLREIADRASDNELANAALGRYYVQSGRFQQAEKYLKAAMARGDEKANLDLADVYLRLNRLDDVQAVLAKDARTPAVLRLAEADRRRGHFDEALKRLDSVLAKDSTEPQSTLRKAELLLEMKRPADALDIARAAIKATPESGPAHTALARALAATGDLAGAFDEYVEVVRLEPASIQAPRELATIGLALGRKNVALEFAQQAVRRNPDDRDAKVNLARVLMRVGDVGTAERTLMPLLNTKANSVDMLVLAGEIHAARGRPGPARAAYLRALELDGHDFDALSALVTLDLDGGRIADARADLNRVGAKREAPGLLRLSARVAMAENKAAEAESLLKRALTLDAADAASTLLLVDLLHRQQRASEIAPLLEQALSHHPRQLDLQLTMAQLLEGTGQTAQAQRRYEDILAVNPESGIASARLAALYVREDRNLDVAMNLASTAKQQLPNDPSVSDTLGWLYVRRNLPASGVSHLKDAVQAQPKNAIYRYHLGVAYLGIDQRQQAQDELNRALTLDPAFPHADDCKARLASLGTRP